MKATKEFQLTINKSFNIFGAVRELFRDNILKPTDTFTVQFTNTKEYTIKVTNELNDSIFLDRKEEDTKYIFEQLEIAIKDGVPSLLDKTIDEVPRCEEASYEQLLRFAEEEETQQVAKAIHCDVFTVCKTGKIVTSLHQLCITNPGYASTLGLFTPLCNTRRAFTEDQARKQIVMAFAEYYGGYLPLGENMNEMKIHLDNITEIYKHSYIIVEPVRQ